MQVDFGLLTVGRLLKQVDPLWERETRETRIRNYEMQDDA